MTALPPCTSLAAQAYHVPTSVIERVAQATSGQGIGVMRIDPGWLPLLERVGFDPDAVRTDTCMNIAAGTWILAWAGAGRTDRPSRSSPNHSVPPPSTPLSHDLSACVTEAAKRYRLPELLYRAILLTEGGAVGRTSPNPNGSYDIGPAQINSSHLPELAKAGISRERLLNDGCLNIHVGAWILARELDGHTPNEPAEFWRRVGNYNSRTPRYNQAYQRKVWRNAQIAIRGHLQAPS
ncbi:conjugal transfer protein TrbN [Acetobacter malorum]|uniref:Conjugal transfer protein TrbN n=1 Tax=Acetobacter malorum TaxID=178901 RepID=A0A149V3I3_9PROT|nr:transglycosylase SLT domain-containing protein [Acetobacter malorum]KXV74682.1 conjugal transfer protein TrbN [Acetobacter malorum]